MKLDLPTSSPHPLLSLSSHHLLTCSFSFFVPTTPWVSPLMPPICDGSSNEDSNCDCMHFIPKKPGKLRCKHCSHPWALHSDPAPTQSQEHPPIATTQQDHNKYIDCLMRTLDASAVHEARRETLQGFHPAPWVSP